MKRFFGREQQEQSLRQNPALANLARAYPALAEVLGTEAGRQRIRGMWQRIDGSLAQRDPVQRVFAGITMDGTRYFEVYGATINRTGSTYDIFIGDIRPGYENGENDLVVVRGEQREAGTRNTNFPVIFQDPAAAATESGRPSQLDLRPVRDGASSLYGEAYNPHTRSDIASTAFMQGLSDFDVDRLRTTMLDDGQPIAHGLQIHQPPVQQAQRSGEIDDIAV
ncbi:MAG: hypothetical protein ABWY71_03335 [Candidatus Saccharimonadales bacterium]